MSAASEPRSNGRRRRAAAVDEPEELDADWRGLKGDVGGLAEAAVERGRAYVEGTRDQAASYADLRKNEAAEQVSGFARSLRDATRDFEDRPNIRAFVDSAAGGLDDLADTIRDRSFTEIFADMEDALRARPLTVAVTGLALGFLAARFIKSSADNLRDESELRAARRRQAAASRARRPRRRGADEA